jgi:23S rRNA pseudouridine955/2504/2580 synthase
MENSVNKNDFMLAKDKLDVVYEDENIIVVNKPIGVVVQDDNTKTVDTLCNRLLKYLFNKKT